MEPIYWYIHGANASPTSFSYIKQMLPDHDLRDVSYSCSVPVMKTITTLVARAKEEGRPIRIISHSLGGIMALHLSFNAPNVEKIVTLGTPFGGSKIASLMRWLTPSQLFDDIHPQSGAVRTLFANKLAVPVRSIVTTGGKLPVFHEPNDGVVTVESQKALSGPEYIEISTNHFEVLLHPTTVDLIQEFLF